MTWVQLDKVSFSLCTLTLTFDCCYILRLDKYSQEIPNLNRHIRSLKIHKSLYKISLLYYSHFIRLTLQYTVTVGAAVLNALNQLEGLKRHVVRNSMIALLDLTACSTQLWRNMNQRKKKTIRLNQIDQLKLLEMPFLIW